MPKKVNTPANVSSRAPAPKGEDSGAKPPSRAKVAKQAKEEQARAPRPGTTRYYVRNVRYTPVAFRLTSTTDRRIELAPRGRLNDMKPVTEDELYDDILLANIGLIIEVLTADQAQQIIAKQSINQQQYQATANPLMDILRDENGNAITNVTITPSNTETEITVASVGDKGEIDRSSQSPTIIEEGLGPKRAKVPGSEDNPIPYVPDGVPPEQAADWLAFQRAQAAAQANDPLAYIDRIRASVHGNDEQI